MTRPSAIEAHRNWQTLIQDANRNWPDFHTPKTDTPVRFRSLWREARR